MLAHAWLCHIGDKAALLVSTLLGLVNKSLGNRSNLARLSRRAVNLVEVLHEHKSRMLTEGSWRKITTSFTDALNVSAELRCMRASLGM